MKEILKDKILALVPEYTGEGANFTKVLIFNKEKVGLKKNINSSLKMLCRFYHFDLKSSNKTSKEMLGLAKSPPVFIKNDLVLIAVKTRTPVGKDDGAYSYINIEMIKRIKEGRVEFKDGSSLAVISSAKTIEKNIKYADILKEMIQNRRGYLIEPDPKAIDKSIENISITIKEKPEVYLKADACLEVFNDLKNDFDIIIKKIEEIQESLLK